MTAWLTAEKMPVGLDFGRRSRSHPSFSDCGARNLGYAVRYYAKWFARGVVVDAMDRMRNMAHTIMLVSQRACRERMGQRSCDLRCDSESEKKMTGLAIQKMEQASLRGRVGESLSAAIISGELAPGTLVSVPTLASQFGVSATPVREAMLDLEQRGFVTPVRNKGFRVTEVREQDLKEILELRQLLEVPAMRALAKDFPIDTLPHWRAIADEISEHADKANLTGFIERDRDFHLGLLELYGNERLVDAVRELRQQTRMVNLVRMKQSNRLHDSAHEHHLMLDLLEKGDGPALENLIVLHLSHVAGWWSGIAESS
jgi:DNA-binding GntR family transcriptional regulator